MLKSDRKQVEKSGTEAIIFDLDGTLWDSVDTICQAWNRGMTALGRPAGLNREKLCAQMGKTVDELRESFFSEVEKEEGLKMLQLLFHIENQLILEQGGKLYPDLRKSLEKLARSYRLMIVSNCGLGYIEAFLTYHQLGQFFCDHENNGRTGLLKGENIRLVMERNKIRRAFYVGDTEGDLDAARLAGIPFIFASYGFGSVPAEACEGILRTFADIGQLLGNG